MKKPAIKLPRPTEMLGRLHTRSFRVGGYSVLAAVIVIAIAVFANVLVGALPAKYTQFDTTSNSLYSLSEQTELLLSGLEDEVTVYWIVQDGAEDSTLGTLLERYTAASDELTVSKVDPDVQPTFVQQYVTGTVYNNSLVVECGERNTYVSYSDLYEYDYSSYYSTGSYDVSFAGESELTSAIDYVTSEDLPLLYTLSGHGEAELSTSFTTAVEKQNIDIQSLSLLTTDGVPEDATLSADTIAQESVLESRPELKEELPGLLSIYDISVRQNGETLEIKDNPMTVKIPLNDHLKGYKYYQAVYLGDPLERFDAVVEGDFLVFETDHLSQYAILGSNTPFETSEKPTDPTDPTDPTTPTDPTDPAGPADPTDPAKPEQQGKPSEQIESPQTGDSSNMALWISLMMVSCGGLLGMLFYKRKKTAAGK